MRIIAFTGPKTCGKDTAAKALLDLPDLGTKYFIQEQFARGTKDIGKLVFGYTHEQLEDPILKETPTDTWPFLAPRVPLMDVANWFRDQYGGTVWVNALQNRLKGRELQSNGWVITDLRFPEELEWLHSMNALVLYVEREEAEMKLSALQAEGDLMALNPSESHYDTMLQGCSAIVQNNGTIPQLHGQVQALVQQKFGHWSHWGKQVEKDWSDATG